MIIDIYKDKHKRCWDNKNRDYHNSYDPDEINPGDYKTYRLHDKLHNIHGPAIIFLNDHVEDCLNGHIEYCLNNIIYSKERWERRRHGY